MTKKAIIKARIMLSLMMLFGAIVLTRQSVQLRAGERNGENPWDRFSEWASNPGNTYQDRVHPIDPMSPTGFSEIVGIRDIILLPPGNSNPNNQRPTLQPPTPEEMENLLNFNYLISQIFLPDPRTRLLPADIDIPSFLETDFRIDTQTDGPQVLIFHTHSMENFVDSDPADPMTGVMGVGRHLAEILANQHGIEVMHHLGRFDMVNGIPQRPGAYERMEPVIRQILADNPSIQVAIDLHRDGVQPHVQPFVTYVNGERTAQIMLVNGLSRQFRNSQIIPVPWLPNPYQRENLAFSLNLQLAANQLYPGIARRIYLLEFRYSLHMLPRSILVEVGAQNNTFQEALNAMEPLANIIAAVVLGYPEQG